MNDILKKRIEEAANDKFTDNTFAYNGFIVGAEYALSHQWISVKEALPENEDWVIVMYDIGLMEVRKGIYIRVNKPIAENLKITHWLPIPNFETKESK